MRSINPISCINRSLHPLPLRPVPTCSVVVGDAVACSSALLTTYSRTCGLHSARTPRATTQLSSGASEHETLAQAARLTLEVQKSKFIATAFPVATGNQALECIRSASDPSASHNCWAYRIGQEARSSDDGEPSGTAGRPILAAIEGEKLDGVAVLVTRHYGGIKLGTGGLARAYGGAARDCLKGAPRVTVRPRARLRMTLTYETMGRVYALLPKYDAEREGEEDYLEGGTQLSITVSVDAARASELSAAVADVTAGAVVVHQL